MTYREDLDAPKSPPPFEPDAPKSPPPLEPDAPQWLVEVRDEFAATGWENTKKVADNLIVGEVLTGAFGTVTKTAPDTIRLGVLPRDDSRVWTVRPGGGRRMQEE